MTNSTSYRTMEVLPLPKWLTTPSGAPGAIVYALTITPLSSLCNLTDAMEPA